MFQTMKMPVLNPLLLTSATKEDAILLSDRTKIRKSGIIGINTVCQNVRDTPSSPENLFLVPINNYKMPVHLCEEYYATRYQIRHKIEPYIDRGYRCITVAGASFVGNSIIIIIKNSIYYIFLCRRAS